MWHSYEAVPEAVRWSSPLSGSCWCVASRAFWHSCIYPPRLRTRPCPTWRPTRCSSRCGPPRHCHTKDKIRQEACSLNHQIWTCSHLSGCGMSAQEVSALWIWFKGCLEGLGVCKSVKLNCACWYDVFHYTGFGCCSAQTYGVVTIYRSIQWQHCVI